MLDSLSPNRLGLAALSLFLLFAALLLLARLSVLALKPLLRGLDRIRLAIVRLAADRGGLSARALLPLLDRDQRELAALLVASLILLVCGMAFFEITESVVERETMLHLDRSVWSALQSLHSEPVDRLMVVLTGLGGAIVTVPLALSISAWLAWRRQWAVIAYWLAAALAARASVVLLKWALSRDRPGNIYEGFDRYSFPSGHAAGSAVLYGFLTVLLAWQRPWNLRLPLFAGASVLICMVGFSRLYLGVHWLSDVVAGYALGLAWVALFSAAFIRFHGTTRLNARALACVALLSVTLASVWNAHFHLDETLDRYREARASATLGELPPLSSEDEADDEDDAEEEDEG